MDSEEKDDSAVVKSENVEEMEIKVESENEDDGLSSKDSEDGGGEYDETEQEQPPAALQSEEIAPELDGDDSHDPDNFEGDGELVEGDASPALCSMAEEPGSGDVDVVECKVEDILDEDHAAFIKSLKVWGNADLIERELVKMPSAEDAVDEVKCARDDRCITLHPFGLDDFQNPKFLAALREKGCEEIRHQFVRPEANRDGWEGFVLLNFGSVSSALRAAEELKDFREGVEVKVQILGAQSSRFNIRRWKAAVKGKHRWSDGLLVVKNIGESTSESKLSTLFPGGSILLHRESSLTSDGALKGLAYVVYADKEEADSVLAMYKGKKIILDGRRLFVMKYFNPEKSVIPEGMLRLGERRLVLSNINELNEMISSANRDTTPLQNKVKALQDLVDKDDCIRQKIGLPTPSLDRLSKMNSLRQFSEREKTTILQRLLNPPLPPPPAPVIPLKPQAPKAENGEKSSVVKTSQTKKRKNRGKKSSKETTVVAVNLSTPPPSLPNSNKRPAFVPRLPVPLPASATGQPVTSLLPSMIRAATAAAAALTSRMRAPLPGKLWPPSLGNWMQPPPGGVLPPAIGPLGTKLVPRIPVSMPPPPVPAPKVPPPLMNSSPPLRSRVPPPFAPRPQMNPPPAHLSRGPPPGVFATRPQRSFPPGSVPQFRVPPPSGIVPRPLVRRPGELMEPPSKRARLDQPPPPRSLLGPLPLPNFRPRVQQRRF